MVNDTQSNITSFSLRYLHFTYNFHEGTHLTVISSTLSPTSQQNITNKKKKIIFLKLTWKFCLLARPSNVANGSVWSLVKHHHDNIIMTTSSRWHHHDDVITTTLLKFWQFCPVEFILDWHNWRPFKSILFTIFHFSKLSESANVHLVSKCLHILFSRFWGIWLQWSLPEMDL